MTATPPRILHTAIDARDARALAKFYRQLLDLRYRPGDEPPADGTADDADWLVLLHADGGRALAIQAKADLRPSTWPSEEVPMQLHLDLAVADVDALRDATARAVQLGARALHERTDDPQEPLIVLADPEGHPFCLLVG